MTAPAAGSTPNGGSWVVTPHRVALARPAGLAGSIALSCCCSDERGEDPGGGRDRACGSAHSFGQEEGYR